MMHPGKSVLASVNDNSTLPTTTSPMRSLNSLFAFAAVGLLPLLTGCNSMEQKLGRGLANVYEPLRMGELRRSVEQNSISDSPSGGPGYGIVHGIARTFQRTAVGAFEVVTFPIPTEPIIHPVAPVYPDSQPRQQMGNLGVGSDQYLGFQDAAVTPFLPGVEFNPLQN